MRRRLLVAGSNSGCQLGLGHNRDARLLEYALYEGLEAMHLPFPPEGWTIKRLSSGSNHTLALLESLDEQKANQLWATGTGAEGQLGAKAANADSLAVFHHLDWKEILAIDGFVLPDFDAAGFELKDIICGWNVSFILLTPSGVLDDGHCQDVLFSLGLSRHNTFGELGVQPSQESSFKTRCAHRVCLEQAIDSVSDRLPLRVTALATGLRHVILELCLGPDVSGMYQAFIVGWGASRHGQLGVVAEPHVSPVSDRRASSSAASPIYQPRCILKLERGSIKPMPSTLRAGRAHTLLLVRTDEKRQYLHAFGCDRQGQLRVVSRFPGEAAHGIAEIASNWNSSQILVKNKTQCIAGSGNNIHGQLGSGGATFPSADPTIWTALDRVTLADQTHDALAHIRHMACGSEHTLLLVDRDSSARPSGSVKEVWGYGWNEHGNLAQGNEEDQHAPVPVLPGPRSGPIALPTANQSSESPGGLPASLNPVNIWAGFGTTFILTTVGESVAE